MKTIEQLPHGLLPLRPQDYHGCIAEGFCDKCNAIFLGPREGGLCRVCAESPAPAAETDTPETDSHQLKAHMAYDRLWSDFARRLERRAIAAEAKLAELTEEIALTNTAL